jgi:hypothetical protein
VILDKRDSIVVDSGVLTVALAAGIFKALRAKKKPTNPIFVLISKMVTPFINKFHGTIA